MQSLNRIYNNARKYSGAAKYLVPQPVRAAIREFMLKRSMRSFLAVKEPWQPEAFPQGINLLGGIRAEMGLGQSCRLAARQILKSGIPFSIYNVNFVGELREQDGSWDDWISGELPYGINLFHVNPCELEKVFMSVPEAWNRRYNIAFWLWELEEFPKEWIKYCALFDEIWTPSEFAGRGIKKVTDVPVYTVPYSVTAPYEEACTRKEFGLPEDQFLYLIMYDSNSTSGRKNPQGAIAAYKQAFPEERPDCGLIIKINNAKPEDPERLRRELAGYRNVYFITETMEKTRVNSLIRCADVFVSLHRSEGFGLVMAEAMLLGTPVVATDWSSNTEFMTKEACCMVGYQLIRNPRTELPYKKGCVWADPDLEEAAAYMKRLCEDREFYGQKAAGGRACINELLNEEKLSLLWRKRIEGAIQRK